MRCSACVLVDHPSHLDWVGHLPTVAWCVRAVEEVRGFDDVCVVCLNERTLDEAALAVAAARTGVPWHHYKPKEEPVASSVRRFDWLARPDSPVVGADVVLCYKASLPFVKPLRIETALGVVVGGEAPAATLAQWGMALFTERYGRREVQKATLRVDHLLVAETARLKEASDAAKLMFIEPIEAIDVTQTDGLLMARALAHYGAV